MPLNIAPVQVMLLGTANSDGTFTGVTVDETTSLYIPCGQSQSVAFVVIGNGTTSSGVVTLEEAYWDPRVQMPYNGSWSVIANVNASDVTGTAQKFVHVDPNAFKFLRARISTVIGGGGGISVALLLS